MEDCYSHAAALCNERRGVWARWLGGRDHARLAAHLASREAWDSLLGAAAAAPPGGDDVGDVPFQLRVRSLLARQAADRLLHGGRAAGDLSESDVYYSLEDDAEDWARLQAEGAPKLAELVRKVELASSDMASQSLTVSSACVDQASGVLPGRGHPPAMPPCSGGVLVDFCVAYLSGYICSTISKAIKGKAQTEEESISHRGNKQKQLKASRELSALMPNVKPTKKDLQQEKQALLNNALEKVLEDLKNMGEVARPFMSNAKKAEAWDYYDVIKHPMDLGTMLKKLRACKYTNKRSFHADIDLIAANCCQYNEKGSTYVRHVAMLQQRALKLLSAIPNIDVLSPEDSVAMRQGTAGQAAHTVSTGPGNINLCDGLDTDRSSEMSSPECASGLSGSQRDDGRAMLLAHLSRSQSCTTFDTGIPIPKSPGKSSGEGHVVTGSESCQCREGEEGRSHCDGGQGGCDRHCRRDGETDGEQHGWPELCVRRSLMARMHRVAQRLAEQRRAFSERDAMVRDPHRMASYVAQEARASQLLQVEDHSQLAAEPRTAACDKSVASSQAAPGRPDQSGTQRAVTPLPEGAFFFCNCVPLTTLSGTCSSQVQCCLRATDDQFFEEQQANAAMQKAVVRMLQTAGFGGGRQASLETICDLLAHRFVRLGRCLKRLQDSLPPGCSLTTLATLSLGSIWGSSTKDITEFVRPGYTRGSAPSLKTGGGHGLGYSHSSAMQRQGPASFTDGGRQRLSPLALPPARSLSGSSAHGWQQQQQHKKRIASGSASPRASPAKKASQTLADVKVQPPSPPFSPERLPDASPALPALPPAQALSKPAAQARNMLHTKVPAAKGPSAGQPVPVSPTAKPLSSPKPLNSPKHKSLSLSMWPQTKTLPSAPGNLPYPAVFRSE
eukprot:SM000024S07855  [mRNA]  locus=s24:912485:917347:+ [translate_table: standard]